MATTAQPTPFTEFIGVCNTTRKNGTDNNTNIDVYIPDLVMEDKCCPSKTKVYPVGVSKLFSCPGGSHQITKKKCITCSYLGGSNCLIPCVYVGERVRVLNYGGDEHFYWLPLGRDNGIRLRERIRWFAMSQPSSISGDNYKDVTDKNSYFIDINTNKGAKQIHLHTSKADGEPVGYDMYILPDLGIWKFHDCKGNILKLETGPHWWYMRNVDDSIVECKAENINILCKDTVTIKAGKHIVMEAGLTYSRKAPEQTITGKNRTSTMEANDTFNSSTTFFKNNNMYITSSAKFGLTTATATYCANHIFSGKGFVVGTASGFVPVTIVIGSNTW